MGPARSENRGTTAGYANRARWGMGLFMPQNVVTLAAKLSATTVADNAWTSLLVPAGSFNGSVVVPEGTLAAGDVLSLSAYGTITTADQASPGNLRLTLYFGSGRVEPCAGTTQMGLTRNVNSDWVLSAQLTIRSASRFVCNGYFSATAMGIRSGITWFGNNDRQKEMEYSAADANSFLLYAQFNSTGNVLVLEQCSILKLPRPRAGSRSAMLLPQPAQRCPNCSTDNPVPVALRAKFDGKFAAGTAANCAELNKPTVLLHSNGAALACCWVSQPIDYCKGGIPGLWMLEKDDPRTWTLSLRRGSNVAATYALTTKKAKDCSFPIKLKFVQGTDECKKWPKSVTIAPGP